MVEQHTMPTMTSPGIKSLDESDLSSASEQLLANLNNFNGKPETSDNEDPQSPENPDSGVGSRVENILDPKMLQKFFGSKLISKIFLDEIRDEQLASSIFNDWQGENMKIRNCCSSVFCDIRKFKT